MREISCVDGMRWRLEALAPAPTGGDGPAAEAEQPEAGPARVALLVCTTCEGDPKQVTIRARADQWRELDAAELCRLIREAEAMA